MTWNKRQIYTFGIFLEKVGIRIRILNLVLVSYLAILQKSKHKYKKIKSSIRGILWGGLVAVVECVSCHWVCFEGTVMHICLDSRHMAGLNTLQLHIHLRVMYASICVCQCVHACVLACICTSLCVTVPLCLSVDVTFLCPPPFLFLPSLLCQLWFLE